jgi:hypothetical protein
MQSPIDLAASGWALWLMALGVAPEGVYEGPRHFSIIVGIAMALVIGWLSFTVRQTEAPQ